jgi:uncharacterized protein (TIGR03437 family)
MRRKSMMVVLLLALGLVWVLPTQWQALRRGKAQAFALNRAATRAVQPARYEFVEHVIDYAHPCDDNFYPRVTRNSAQATYDFMFRSDTLAAGCTSALIPDGKITLNFPASFTEGVAFTPAINVTGTFQLRVDAQHFSVRGYGLTVDTVIDRLPKREDQGVHQDLRNAPCPLSRFRKAPPLTGGTGTTPGLNPFANNASCSVRAPDPFQDFEGNQVLLISTVDLVVGGDPIGPANYFNYTGLRLLRFTITSKYRPATNSCPTLGLQNGLADPAQPCPPAKLLVETQAEVFAGNSGFVRVSARKADGTLDTGYNGPVQVSLAPGTTPKLACLQPTTLGATCAATQTLTMVSGSVPELLLRTPEQPLTPNTVLKANDPPLAGNVVVKAEVGNISATSETKVKSPLDLKIDRIEVQQGYKPVFASDLDGPWVQYRDLLIRVFVDANRTEFGSYDSIRDLTASLTVRNQAGAHIEGSPFALKLSAFAKGTERPNDPYVFQRVPLEDEQGSSSLNHVLFVTQEQLSLSVKLDDVYPDKDPANNEKTLPPLRFVTSKPMTVLYSPAQLKTATQSTGCPAEASIANEINLVQQAYPVSYPESRGQLRFIQAPNPNKTEACEVLTGDPLPRRPITRWWFWLNRTKLSNVSAWVYFVHRNFFPLTDRPSHGGISDKLGGSVSIVSDRCLGPDTDTQCGILAHEFGHLLNLGDTYQSTAVTPVRSPNNPPLGGAAGNEVGLGTYSWFHHRFTVFNTDIVDYMGAANDTWTDRVNWNYLRTQLLPAANATAAEAQDALAEAAAADNFVIVQGQVRKNGAAEFTTCYTLTGAGLADDAGNGDYVIETLDANAAVLGSLSFTPSFRPTDSDVDLEAASFSYALPFSSAVRQLRIRSAAGILATRQVSTAAPVVNFTTDFGGQTLTGRQTVRWNGSDADGNALSYSLFYSPDGQLQIPLALETTDTSCEWDTAEVPAGSAARLTLTATDGVNATTIESRTFTLFNHAPHVVILTPAHLQQFKTGETVNLSASLYDAEDGWAFRPAFTWVSDLQGALGTGRQLALNNLQVGTHRITATGADSQGARGSATITVIVRADNFSNLEATPGSADFGTVTVGQTRDFNLRVQNTGNAPLTINAVASNNPQFRVLIPATPFTVAARSQQELTLRFTPLAAGDQTGTLTITANASNRASLNITLAGRATGLTARAVATVSAASFSGQTLAAESIVAAFGSSLATSVIVADTLPLPTQLAGTTVRVRDSQGTERLAPLFFVAPQQINYLVPAGTATGTASIIVTSGDGALSIGTVTITAVAPGLFTANATGQGVPAAVALRIKANGAQSYEPVARLDTAQNRFVAAPIDLGPAGDQVFLLLFGTGLRFNSGLPGVTVKLGGVDAPVSFAGAQGDLAGLDQVNLSVPRALAGRGEVDLTLTVDGSTANTVRVAFAGNQTCSYALASASQSFPSSGGTGSVNVTAQNGCAWMATSNANFITITNGASGAGNSTVNYSVAVNTASSTRTGTLTIAGQTFTITQAGGSGACSFTLTPTNQVFAASGGSGSINVATQAGCNWMAATAENWIAITAGRTGSGNGRVDFTLAANSSTIPRAGAIMVAGQTFLIGQTGTGATCRLLPISIGQTINGELATSDCGSPVYGSDYSADLFYFTATAGQRVAIQLTSAAFDAYLILIGPDGEPVTEDDDGGGGTDARIPASSGFLTLPLSGTYIIEASSAFEREIGAYRLSLSAPSSSASGKTKGAVTNRLRAWMWW